MYTFPKIKTHTHSFLLHLKNHPHHHFIKKKKKTAQHSCPNRLSRKIPLHARHLGKHTHSIAASSLEYTRPHHLPLSFTPRTESKITRGAEKSVGEPHDAAQCWNFHEPGFPTCSGTGSSRLTRVRHRLLFFFFFSFSKKIA